MAQLKDTVISGSLAVSDNVAVGNAYKQTVFVGTGTAAQDMGSGVSPRYFPAKWTFNGDVSLVDGTIVTIKVPIAGHSYGVFISFDNGTTYNPIIYGTNTKLTTHFGVGNIVRLMYDSSGSCAIYPVTGGDATATITSVWRVLNMFDSNTTYSAQTQALLEAGTNTSNRTIRSDVFKATMKSIIKAGTTNGYLSVYDNDLTIYELPTASADTLGGVKIGTGLSISDGVLSASALPSVSASDDGKIMMVVNGAWAAAEITNANGQSF